MARTVCRTLGALALFWSAGLAPTQAQENASSFLAFTACCPNQLVRYDVVTGDATVLAEVGTAERVLSHVMERYDDEGNLVRLDTVWTLEGDFFVATAGSGVLDPEGDHLFLIRNQRLVTVDLRGGAVADGPPLDGVLELVGYSARHQRLYALTMCCPNRIIEVDPATGETGVVAEVGTMEKVLVDVTERYDEDGNVEGRDTVWTQVGDLFSPLSGPAVTATGSDDVFFIRNGRLLAVNTASGALREGPPLEGTQLLAYDGASGLLYLFTSGSPAKLSDPGTPNRLLAYRPDTGQMTTVAELGRWRQVLLDVVEQYDEQGNVFHRDSVWAFEGDFFTVSVGLSVFDEESERIFLRRNERLLTVATRGGVAVTEGTTMEGLMVVGVLEGPEGVGREEEAELPEAAGSVTASPNPFRTEAVVTVSLAGGQPVRLEVFDVLGRRVATLYDGWLAGRQAHRFTLAAGGLPAGLYLVSVRGEAFARVKPIVLLR